MLFRSGEYEMPLGTNAPAQFYAHMARRHMETYGTTSDQFAEVAMTCRQNAQMNERAMMRKPMTLEDHQNSPLVSEPLHRFDCCLETDGALAVVVTTPERARDLRQPPVAILGATQGMGPEHVVMANYFNERLLEKIGRAHV